MSGRQRIKFLWTLFLIGLALLGLAAAASATTLARLEFRDLVSQASGIARLRCVRSVSLWKHGEIWTQTEFQLLAASKGSLPPVVQIEMPGGVIGHLHSRVAEVPSFAPGEDVYLFLWAATDGTYRVLGWSQGSFRIHKDNTTGVEDVTQDSAGAPLFDPVTRQFRHGGVRNLPIPIFELRLKRALEQR